MIRDRAVSAVEVLDTYLAQIAPWNLNYTPGRSSSGSAAAIAAGLSPLDIGDRF